jgi:hypothetical protein
MENGAATDGKTGIFPAEGWFENHPKVLVV